MVTVPDFPPNRKTDKVEPKAAPKVESVVTKPTGMRKAPLLKRLSRSIIAEDSGSVTEYVLLEVLLPHAKNTISDMVSQGINQLLYGGSYRGPRAGGGTMTNYSTPSKGVIGSRTSDPRPMTNQRERPVQDTWEDILFFERGEAEAVLDRLVSTVDEYDSCSVAMLLGFAGKTPSWTDEKIGWTSLPHARARQVRGGWVLDLPNPVKLDDA